jgi:FMN phosphatase YigB (HAD superfamily)
LNAKARARVCAEIGERDWLDDWLAAELEPTPSSSYAHALAARGARADRFEPDMARQETVRWYRDWFEGRGIDLEGIDLERLRSLMCVPLDEVSTRVPGATEALRWCVERGLRVVLVTNTLSRGDEEALEDWRRFGVADAIHGVVSSHSVGWRKPHPAIFERALELAGTEPSETFHVGDNLIADVWGAQQLGIRAIWRRSAETRGTAAEEQTRVPRGASCRHNSAHLHLEDGDVRCRDCREHVPVEIRPDAIVDDLTELPPVVEKWLRL